MMKIEAIVREEKLEDIKEVLEEKKVDGVTVYQVMGCGVQRGYTEVVRGTEVDLMLLPKVKLEIVVASEPRAREIMEAIRKAAYTGCVGDGKLFLYEIADAVKVRTGETGDAALCEAPTP